MKKQYTFFIISRSFLLRMKTVSHKSCRETRNTHFVFNNFFFNCAFCEIMWKSIVERRRAHGACALHAGYLRLQTRTHTHTHTHTQNVQYYLLLHRNNGCTNASHCYVIVHRLSSWNFNFTSRWIFPRANSAGLLPIDLATKTNNNYKNSHLWRTMREKRTVLPRDRTFRVEDSTPQFLMSSAHFRNRIAVRSEHSDCERLYTLLDMLHPVLQYFNLK
jgi:hypothetical protein